MNFDSKYIEFPFFETRYCAQGLSCLMDGSATTQSHVEEVKVVKEMFGEDVPCKIGVR